MPAQSPTDSIVQPSDQTQDQAQAVSQAQKKVSENAGDLSQPAELKITADGDVKVEPQQPVAVGQSEATQSPQPTQFGPTQPTQSSPAVQAAQPDQPQQVQPSQTQASDQPAPLTPNNFPGLLGILVTNNVLDPSRAQEINNAHLSQGKSIEQLLEEDETVSELQLIKAKAELNNIPFIDINDTGASPEALNKIDESVAKRYQVLPFSVDEEAKVLKVAMADPLNLPAINFIEQKTGYKLETCYALPKEIARLIAERYAQDLSEDVSAAVEETSTIDARREALALDQAQRGGFVRAAPINKIVSTLLDYAIQSRASDVHIEPLPEKTRVRYRIDGILHERLILPKSVHEAVVSRVKILSDLKIDEKRVPQDGRFDYKGVDNQEVDLRVSTCPSIHGEKVVMRLLKKNEAVPSLEELGMSGLALQRVKKAIKIPHGIFLVTGPTGSGKTTSLYSILHNINTPKVNIITLEDPVEYQMHGVTQVQVHPQAGLTFANGLRSFLRQDPDIIMVGEIRDTETAELAVQASLTGHLVFSTLHTNSAAGALPRLHDMGVEPFLLSSSIILVMGQRVVRRINPDYKEEYKPEPSVIEDIRRVLGAHFDQWCEKNNKQPEEITLFRPKENRPQNEPDYKGRIGIFEVMDISDPIKSLINRESPADDIEEQAMKEGMILMKQDGYIKALEGITTIEEVLRVAEVLE
jgi:type IV pilus assembly protein PilB